MGCAIAWEEVQRHGEEVMAYCSQWEMLEL